ncbi:hypothetical protein HQ496_04260 [bacterium]|nr:hypothetical protein [bacterium]
MPLESYAQTEQGPYFYRGQDFGSEGAFNPFVWVINDGFDIFQVGTQDRKIANRNYRTDFNTVWDNLSDPFGTIQEFGWRNFISHEVFPLDFNMDTAQWAPNYLLHVIGGGISYRTLHEYYSSHGIKRAGWLTLGTIATERLINEMNENHGRTGLNVDAIADIYIFDTMSILLFQSTRVQRFWGNTMNAAVWGKQPSITLNSGELHNVGQNYVLKWGPSHWERTKLFSHFGMGFLGGLSITSSDGLTYSFGAGFKTSKLREVDPKAAVYTIVPAASIGFFIDQNNSLLASLVMSNAFDKVAEINVYPSVLPLPHTGLWASVSRQGQLGVGVTTKWAIGAGVTSK